MLVVRLAREADLEALFELAASSYPPLTNLPAWREGIATRINESLAAVRRDIASPGNEAYMFVLEDRVSQRVVGTATLRAHAGQGHAYYTYRRETLIHASPGLGLRREVDVLSFSHEISSASQLCALALAPDYADEKAATSLLRQARLVFMGHHPERFSDWCAVAYAGVSDAQGISPFWESVGRHFFGRDFNEVNDLAGRHAKSFIAEMMPQWPLYEELLGDQARAVIGQPHPLHQGAFNDMVQEGFEASRHIDIFDAGPLLTAPVTQLKTLKRCQPATLVAGAPRQGERRLLVHPGLEQFCAIYGERDEPAAGGIRIDAVARAALAASDGSRLLEAPVASTDTGGLA